LIFKVNDKVVFSPKIGTAIQVNNHVSVGYKYLTSKEWDWCGKDFLAPLEMSRWKE
jgi:hypothetical protein